GPLALPQRVVPGGADLVGREAFVQRLEFLQAGDVRLLALQPAKQVREARLDAIDVEGRDLHRRPDPTEHRPGAGLDWAGHTGGHRCADMDPIPRAPRRPAATCTNRISTSWPTAIAMAGPWPWIPTSPSRTADRHAMTRPRRARASTRRAT